MYVNLNALNWRLSPVTLGQGCPETCNTKLYQTCLGAIPLAQGYVMVGITIKAIATTTIETIANTVPINRLKQLRNIENLHVFSTVREYCSQIRQRH